MQPILVVMAAGMGSRYGGLKQVDPVGVSGEFILDYSLYDAYRAGFRRVLFIIRKEHEALFQAKVVDHLPKDLSISLVFQEPTDLPAPDLLPEGRTKPLGTAQAIYAARKLLDAPFAVINADDYYGRKAFAEIFHFLTTEKTAHAMLGYRLARTLTDKGAVSRGICQVEGDRLIEVVEHPKIYPDGANAKSTFDDQHFLSLSGDQMVSMNFWGFQPMILEEITRELDRFLREDLPQNPLRAECYLPTVVMKALQAGRAEVKVLPTEEQWMGITYQADKEGVRAGFQKLAEEDYYPTPLWA